MERRRFLRSASAITIGIAGLAGCGSPGPSPDGEATETEPVDDGTETDGGGAETDTETEGDATETETGTDGETETETETGAGAVQRYRLGGRVEAWIGREPESIADRENPTLELEAGEEYEVTWENLDGQPHDLAIQDADGNTLESTERMSEEGATRSLAFAATGEMSRYICTVHPTTMVGEIEIRGG